MRRRLHWIWAYHIKHRAARLGERLTMWVAWHLPRSLVLWCSVRLAAHATAGKYGSTVVPELTFMDALKRWERG